MNVTNRRKSTDADTPQPIPPTQQQQQLLAHVSCRQAATATDTTSRREQLHSLQLSVHKVLDDSNDDQEQVVTSTSSDCLLPLAAEGEGEEVTLELGALVTSPALITSSTNNYEILTYNLDSLSHEEMVMPSTSDNSRIDREAITTTVSLNTITHQHSINTGILRSSKDTVARDVTPTTVVTAGDSEMAVVVKDGTASTSSSNLSDGTNQNNHKIILKLSKPSLAASTESQSLNPRIEDDSRKVEPLKINLLNTHHTSHHMPRITIKPVVKEPPTDILMSSEECSSSAEDEMVSKLTSSEPHIVPKLTIRAKNEELSTVVPKLTIKINDSANISSDSHNTHPAANTPPLPKLTIKTGHDGHSESIITNISPASSTTSSSSSSCSFSSTSINSHVGTNSSTANLIPKLTIKPLQKSLETMENEQHPSIPKLCIKSNIICSEIATTDNASTSKIPKLTIKTGQEHTVIITQHNDHANVLGGIPKLTIKTKSMDSAEDFNNAYASNAQNSPIEKIPKITIKTNNIDSPNIVGPKRSIIKSQLETNPLSPKQAVPKLTIMRQQIDMVVTNKHAINSEEECTGSIPKMTIKTQSKTETVPKLTIKNICCQQRPSSTEESGMESDDESAGEGILPQQHCKTVPKLTIKNLGSPQQKLTIVQETSEEVKKTNALFHGAPVSDIVNVISSPVDADEFVDLLTVDNAGGESSNSQEFCGFNDNTADSVAKISVRAPSDLITHDNKSEVRRNSDDMDIDEDLQTVHEPKIFQNDIHFINQPTDIPELLNGTIPHSKVTQIIDTVDLTSSPSRSCSPAQFDYNDDSNSTAANVNNMTNSNLTVPSTNILLERLQRETTVIQNAQRMENNSPIPPPLQAKPNVQQPSPPAALKYPQLAGRLMANGTSSNAISNNNNNSSQNIPPKNLHSKEENIIDSIEILDTPEGSPRNSLDERPENLQPLSDRITKTKLTNGLPYSKDSEIYLVNNNNSNLKRNALNEHLVDQINLENNIGELPMPPSKQRRLENEAVNTKNLHVIINNNINLIKSKKLLNLSEELKQKKVSATSLVPQLNEFNCLKHTTSHQRARKQKHEHLLPVAMEEVVESAPTNSNDSFELPLEKKNNEQLNENNTPVQKKRGRPRKFIVTNSTLSNECNAATCELAAPAQKDDTPQQLDLSPKSRRVQLLRKRLAIDMVDADEPLRVLDEMESSVTLVGVEKKSDLQEIDSTKRERNLRTPLRTSRRSNTPTVMQMESKLKSKASSLAIDNNNKRSLLKQNYENEMNNFTESNSSILSSAGSNSSTKITAAINHTSHTLSMTSQIDLTMSSSSSNSNGSTTNTITTVEATYSKQASALRNVLPVGLILLSENNTTPCVTICPGGGSEGSSNNSMLPPASILSSSDPLPDVIFKHNDFSSILATQQLRVPIMSVTDTALTELQDEDIGDDVSGPENSGEDSASSSSLSTTPGRGRGRGRGSRGGRGRAYKAHRLGRNASAISKAIAMNRPRCVGALKHTPDPERIKGLYSPSPSVFEEDTRMSADLSQNSAQSDSSQIITKQPDFLTNEESQSSVISNTSMLDPNNVAGLQNCSSTKKLVKRKKMEVCVAEDAELTVSSIAEYDWPPPKGCCPSKNRDTFMIQEQVALYLGIKSFKRKYPELPRRQIDMEERNYLQEKNLVSEKMCDLGITAVWASDILDIMYTDFYDKYEEYKDFVRQKHLREIEAKQKSLGLNVAGRGLQARDRAMLSASKWNSYFNRVRRQERLSFLDLQTLTVHKPCTAAAPIATISNRPVTDEVSRATKTEKMPQLLTLLKERIWEPIRSRDIYYPLSLVPGQFCEKYYYYSPQELGQYPLNTVLYAPSHILPPREETDTDSAAETNDFTEGDKNTCLISVEGRYIQRRIRRLRAKHTRKLNNAEFKVPPLPGVISNSSTESSSSSSDDSSSETDLDTSSCSSSSTDNTSENETSPAKCAVCQHPQNRNLKDLPELFLQCYTCRRKVHPSCIEMPHRMVSRVRNYNWQCADCKCCIKCKRKQDQNKMLYCEQCDRGFHIYCLSIKAVPDGRWSCERCCICMRCGAIKPEGFPIIQPNGEKLKIKQRKLKWINEYHIDHVTKVKEHCSMLCVLCGRTKNVKRVQINTNHNTTTTYMTSPSSSAISPMQSPTAATTATITSPTHMSADQTTSGITTVHTAIHQNMHHFAAGTTATQSLDTNQATTSKITLSFANAASTAISLEHEDSISLTTNLTTNITLENSTARAHPITPTTANALSLPSVPPSINLNTTATTIVAGTTAGSGNAPPVVA